MRTKVNPKTKRFLMPRYLPELKDKSEREISSKDLTKTQLLGYIFADFVKGGFVVVSLIIDILLLPEPYTFVSGFHAENYVLSFYFGGVQLLSVYVLILIFFSESLFIYIEIVVYSKFWGRGVVPWYYKKRK